MVGLLFAAAAAALLWPVGRLRPFVPSWVVALGVWRAAMSAPALGQRSPGTAIKTSLAVLTAGLLAAVAAGPVAALLATFCACVVAAALRAKRVAGASSQRRSAELEFLSALAAELRSGRHPAAALAAVHAPADDELATALAAARATAALGGDVSGSLRRSAGNSALAKLAAAWQLSEECGAPLADLVTQVARDVQAAVDLHRAAHLELTGARATGLVLTVLPLLGVALGAAMDAHPLHVLLHTPAGAVCAVLGLLFELAGLVWVRRLTNGARICRQ